MAETVNRTMNKIAIIRHGDCGPDSRLNGMGIQQIYGICEKLQQILLKEETALILSSHADRAMDSAK